MVPLMMRAKRIAVIGDKQQLSHICLLSKQTDLSLINTHEIEARWSYRGSSMYDLAESMAEAENIIQLRDHHRSFLDIIQFSNQEFYEPNPDTIHRREDGLTVGALKSETTKSGSPDWSGNKSFSIIGIGN